MTTCEVPFDSAMLMNEVHTIFAIVITLLVLQLIGFRCCVIKQNDPVIPEHTLRQIMVHTPQST